MKKTILLLITCFFCITSSVGATEAYVVESTDGKTLTFYYDDNKATREGTVYNLTQNWRSTVITTVIFDSSFTQARPTTTKSWFRNCYYLETLEGLQYFNTSEVTDMSYMFSGCSRLKSLDVSNFNTSNVTDMSYMFSGCSRLKSLDVSNFNTSNVTNMNGMFSGCNALTSIDLSKFNTQNVTDMGHMFSYCSSLKFLDLSSFNTTNVTNMDAMFLHCSSLKSLNVSNFNTARVTDMGGMFHSCSSLKSLDISCFNTDNVKSIHSNCYYKHSEDDIVSIFENCSSLESLNINGLSFKNVSDMSNMFMRCNSLKSLNLESFNTQNVTDMNSMFDGCLSLTNLNIRNFNTIKVKDMAWMFSGCKSLSTIDVSSFNTSNVTDMSGMFLECSGLMNINIMNFNTEKVRSIGGSEKQDLVGEYNSQTVIYFLGGMFSGCSSLKSIDLSNFNTQNISNMSCLFKGCTNLKTIDVSSFNTENVINMAGMFASCKNLESIDVSNFNTEKVTNFGFVILGGEDEWADYRNYYSGGMFEECRSLKSLDLRNFDISNRTTYNFIRDCAKLKTLYVPSSFENLSIHSNYLYGGACEGIGSETNPCVIIAPDGFDFGVDDTDEVFMWKDGYFTLDTEQTNIDNEPYVLESADGLQLTFYHDNQLFSRSGAIYRLNSINNNSFPSWHSSKINSVIFDSSFVNTKPISTYGWFLEMNGITLIEGLENLNTSDVKNMGYMFYNCSGLTSLDLKNFNTQNVTNMGGMFDGCSSLSSLDLRNFDMSKVTSSTWMLRNCSSLKSLFISPTMENIVSACSGVGTQTSPCVIYAPDGFDFGVDTSGDYFIWKGGYFTLGKQEYEGKMGDVNNDGVVSISDAICIISWLQENTLPVFIEGAADYNKDGSITVSDALAIIQMLLTLEPDPVIPDIPNDDISQLIPTTSAKGIDINLSNDAKYTAFTMDVALPEGMTVNDISLDTRRAPRHQLVFNRLSDGRYRVIGFSPTLDSFNGNNGTLLTIKTNKKGTGKICIDNIHFVDLNAQEYSLNASHGNTTGIDIVNSEMKVYVNGSNIIVEADNDMDVNVYTVSGLLYKTLGVKAGRNVFSCNDAGIYIANGTKLIIR